MIAFFTKWQLVGKQRIINYGLSLSALILFDKGKIYIFFVIIISIFLSLKASVGSVFHKHVLL